MACWIDVRRDGGRIVVSVAGRLDEAHVPDLLLACDGDAGTSQVRLTDLLSADLIGCEALARLQARGATLTDVPQYIRLRLHAAARVHGS